MRNNYPSRYFVSGIAMIIIGIKRSYDTNRIVSPELIGHHDHALLFYFLFIIIGVAFISYSIWLASVIAKGKGKNFIEYIGTYLSRNLDGMTIKDVAVLMWGQALFFVVLLTVVSLTMAIIWIIMKAINFAT